MPLYENVLIARNDVTQQQVDTLCDTITALIAELGGEVKKREPWGLRSLAFRIKKNRKGHYVLFNIDAPPAAITELERQLSLNEDVLRFMTVRVEELEEAPSAMLQRREREDRDRGERGFGGGGGGGGRFGDRGPRPPRGDRPGGDRPFGDRGDRGGFGGGGGFGDRPPREMGV